MYTSSAKSEDCALPWASNKSKAGHGVTFVRVVAVAAQWIPTWSSTGSNEALNLGTDSSCEQLYLESQQLRIMGYFFQKWSALGVVACCFGLLDSPGRQSRAGSPSKAFFDNMKANDTGLTAMLATCQRSQVIAHDPESPICPILVKRCTLNHAMGSYIM